MHQSAAYLIRTMLLGIILYTLAAAGCSYTVSPRKLRLPPAQEDGAFQGTSVLVRNGETDKTPYRIVNGSGGRTGLVADRQAWTQKLVESVAASLARRGAQVRSGAPVTLSLTIPEIIFIETESEYALRLKVSISADSGYVGTFPGTASASKYRVASGIDEANRLAGDALADAVRSILEDTGIRAILGGTK